MTDYLQLKTANCKNCYKCIRHCPVKSIRFSGNQAHIVSEECILCGQCFVVCPQNAKEIRSDLEKARMLIMQNERVVASLAPSFIANYDGVGIHSMRTALLKLGFADVEETARGATLVKQEYDRLAATGDMDVIISSCCYSVNLLIQKHFPDLLPSLAPVLSPMQTHSRMSKQADPAAKTIFIGPCLSKKAEADQIDGLVDCVLTFEELSQWLAEENIALVPDVDSTEQSRTRIFPTAGGILKSMDCTAGGTSYLSVDGIDNCIAALQDVQAGRLSHCFIEMSACAGSCIGGPVMEKKQRSPVSDYLKVDRYAGRRDFNVPALANDKLIRQHPRLAIDQSEPDRQELQDILLKMGKTRPEHELNCGTCGYNTCREKATAVFQGKADLTMCLPFLKDRAESFSDHIIKNTPNGIIVLNDRLEVQQINAAARQMMNIRDAADVLGSQVVRILDPMLFEEVLSSGRSVHNRRIYLAEYDRTIELTVLYDHGYHILMGIMRDVTAEQVEKDKKEQLSRQTIEIADKVVEKQMRIVQEIASLLGETTAETKIALTRLKESMRDE